MDRFKVVATYFDRDTKNQIDFVSCTATTTNPLCFANGGPPLWATEDNIAPRPRPTASSLKQGRPPARLVVPGQPHLDRYGERLPGNANRKKLTRRSEHQANIQATSPCPTRPRSPAPSAMSATATTTPATPSVLQSCTLLDLKASYPVNETFEVYGRVENAFDDDYETTRNYSLPGRGAIMSVSAPSSGTRRRRSSSATAAVWPRRGGAFPDAPAPWLDLSTGINPRPWKGRGPRRRARLPAWIRRRSAALEAAARACSGSAPIASPPCRGRGGAPAPCRA